MRWLACSSQFGRSLALTFSPENNNPAFPGIRSHSDRNLTKDGVCQLPVDPGQSPGKLFFYRLNSVPTYFNNSLAQQEQ